MSKVLGIFAIVEISVVVILLCAMLTSALPTGVTIPEAARQFRAMYPEIQVEIIDFSFPTGFHQEYHLKVGKRIIFGECNSLLISGVFCKVNDVTN
jgi:hypothetical protein